MNVLLIGSGGREHALAIALSKSPLLRKLFVAPGNPGTAEIAENVVLNVSDHRAVVDFCKIAAIDLVVIGPEQPLVDGLVDDLEASGIAAFGPSREAARLEGSKAYTKALCDRARIPTAAYGRFSDRAAALAYLEKTGAPIVVKADGLAAGKGVVVAETIADARAAVEACFSGAFGAAGAEVVIEEKLEGEEASLFALSDGERVLALGSAQDHKRVGEGDTGPNTGGMGAYSPAPIMSAAIEARAMAEIVEPAIAAMRAAGAPFKGVLFAGLMIGRDGPKLIEFNARFGDPETQVVVPRLDEDLLALMHDCALGRLRTERIRLKPRAALTVVLAAQGYPGEPERGTEINGIARAAALPDVVVTHAGTKRDGARLLANGGRVLNVTGFGADVRAAREAAYKGVDAIDWPGGFCRRDIGWRALG
ncbi:MAG: phosphoribosylamine--glycine ligase [Hyphomicrobiales bacterium]|nr:phosphoribosylamine--glycine ligase [Hyphomicrobiales bacterium]